MIVFIISIVLVCIFFVLGALHFYWFFGGVWGLQKVIPTKSTTENTIKIPKFATLIVALVLSVFGIFYAIKGGIISYTLPERILQYGSWGIPAIFILRAIGDFKYVGFFKKIKNTEFAKADSQVFSSLCLGLGVLGIVLQYIA